MARKQKKAHRAKGTMQRRLPKKRAAPQKRDALPRQGARSETKLQACVELLARSAGATLAELQSVTSWQPHSVRGFLSGTVRKKLGLDVTSSKEERGRVYRIARADSAG